MVTSSEFELQRGLLIVLSGPSGAGKNSLVNRMRELHLEIQYSLSVTTRAPRSGERNGVNYYFVTVEEFQEMIKKNELIEWAEVYSNYYGTPKVFVEKSLEEGRVVLLDLDIQGAVQLKRVYPEAVLIYLLPPNLNELLFRIDKRGADSNEVVALRTKSIRKELEAISDYDYLIVNDFLDNAVTRLWSIITAEKSKVKRIRIDGIVKKFFTSSS
jgi:guanylate kinase